jgi:putative hydrolase of the HAD superfamily
LPTRAVLLDLDDTLVDHRYALRAALSALHRDDERLNTLEFEFLLAEWQRLLEEMHEDVAIGRVSVHESRVLRYRRFYEMAGCTVERDEAERIAERHLAEYMINRRIVPGAAALMERISAQAPIAIGTNNTVREQVEKLATFGLDRHVDALITSEECGVAKPDGAIFRCALERLEVDARDAVMVGDSWDKDVVGATQAGIRAVWLNRFDDPCPDPSLAAQITSFEPVDRIAGIVLHG